jgi:50S ribosomal protein L16 3-hydroxylase
MMELRPGLAKLVHPIPEGEFIDDFWSGRPFVLHGRPERLPELTLHPSLQSPAHMMEACRGTSVTAMMLDRKDESSSVQVTPDVALKLYDNGMNLSVSSAEKFVPSLEPWIENLKVDLGMASATWGRCIVYMSPANSGAPVHFDVNVNFSLQIRGRKTWTLAPNESVKFPTERLVLGMEEPSDSLRAEACAPFPKKLPDDVQVIELLPGSLLCIPHGYWHTTVSAEETIALNFTFGKPTWSVILARALVKRLHRQEAWRKSPNVRAESRHELELLREAQALCAALRKDVDELDPRELVRAASPLAKLYRRADGVNLRLSGGTMTFEISGRGWMPIEASEEYLHVLQSIFERSGWFRSSDALTPHAGSISHADVVLLLRRLVDAKLVECRDE